ncbi:copper amine oxidase N-terminal domain-containing protein [Paenibacillus sp. M1]|uniref:Copper amine oxidase N-terminal domain-containing protein n=1 Tax=Paenibacillus haidiansis TaxID=1574488 RepID=A0ABU7VYL1_9BACL
MKKWIGAILVAAFVSCLSPVASADIFDDSKVKVIYNGTEQNFEPKAVIWNDYTLVPFRQVFELYGADVQWNNETKMITATKDDLSIEIPASGKKAFINGEEIELAQGPLNAKGTTLVGLRFVSEALGAEVSFDKATLTVYINTDEFEPEFFGITQ